MVKKYLFILPLLVGCSQGGDNRLKEKAQIESETAAKNQTEAEIKAQNVRSTEMESDLAQRHNFFQTVKGNYEGSFQTDLGEFQVRISLVPSLNPIKVERIRLPEEVASDLNNLHFNAQVQIWSSDNPGSASGCRIENIRPDLNNGIVNIVSNNCPNVYFLALSNSDNSKNISAKEYYESLIDNNISAIISQDIVTGQPTTLNELAGFLRMTNLAISYHFRAKRVEQ